MKSYFLLIFLCFFILQKNQAQNECIDSISFNRYVSPYFGFPNATSVTLRDAVGNIYINGFGSLPGEINYNIAKFNIENKLVWFKTFKQIPGNQVSLTGLKELDGKTNLVFAIGAGNATNTTVVKLDSSATFLWGRKFERIDFPLVQGTISGIVTDNTENTYLSGFFVDDIEKSNIVKIDGTGTINWSKKYGNINLSKFHVLQRQLVSQNPGTLVLFTHFYYDADLPTESNAKHGLAMVKISKANGSIISQKVMMYYNNNIGTNQNLFTLKKVNYSTATRTFLIDSWGQVIPPFSRSHILTLMDDDLNPIKTVLYNSYFINPVENLMVNDKNEMVFTINRPIYNGNPENSLAYITVADNLEIIRQKKINLSNLSFPDNGFIANIILKNNGLVNFQLSLGAFVYTNNPIYLFDTSPFYENTNSYCLGKDSIIYNKGAIYTFPVSNVNYSEVSDVPFSAVNVTPDPYENQPFPKTELCKTISICDTIKLFGTQFHCLNSPLDSFKIFRNPLCMRKTSWQVDTNYIKILSQNDTALYVQYLRPYRGSIKVAFGGCSLTDEIPIEVYAPKTSLSLGPDTVNCPVKSTILRAGTGFRNYLWNDGSNADTLSVNLPGTYWVMATDSCGTVFRDTVVVNPFDVTLNLNYPRQLCRRDTAFFTLPDKLYNYTWQPAAGASLNNYTWRLFPSATTVYTITGERLPGCFLSDTVLIDVKNCPSYILFPNAFTPNNDGLNDRYKPSVVGTLQSYELIIYNRYGQPVFRSKDPNDGWNGSFKNSSKPLAGTYVWFCRYRFNGGQPLQEKGTFMLIR